MAIFKLSSILKNSSALGSFNCIFENNSLKALFGQNMKKLKILKLSPDSRYLQKLALKGSRVWTLNYLTMVYDRMGITRRKVRVVLGNNHELL